MRHGDGKFAPKQGPVKPAAPDLSKVPPRLRPHVKAHGMPAPTPKGDGKAMAGGFPVYPSTVCAG